MLPKEFTPTLKLADHFPLIDSIKKYRPDYYPVAALTPYNKKQLLDLPVVSKDSTILLSEVTITGKGHKPFRDKMMGQLDSLAQINLNTSWVCGSCGLILNYKSGYEGHHEVNNCPAKSKSRPIDGHRYKIAKYEHFAPTANGVPFRVIDVQEVIYHAPQYIVKKNY